MTRKFRAVLTPLAMGRAHFFEKLMRFVARNACGLKTGVISTAIFRFYSGRLESALTRSNRASADGARTI